MKATNNAVKPPLTWQLGVLGNEFDLTVRYEGRCADCEAVNVSEHLQAIGEDIHVSGSRECTRTSSHYSVGDVGSFWLRVRDSGGLGGNETYHHYLTTAFY